MKLYYPLSIVNGAVNVTQNLKVNEYITLVSNVHVMVYSSGDFEEKKRNIIKEKDGWGCL